MLCIGLLVPQGASAYAGVSSTQAWADVVAAMQNDPNLATPAADFPTPQLQGEFGQVAGDVAWLDKLYAGASTTPADNILSNPTFTSEESNVVGQLTTATLDAAPQGATEAAVGGQALDAAGSAGLLSGLGLPLTLAATAGSLTYLDITTGSNPISVALFGTPATDGPAPSPSTAGSTTLSVNAERWSRYTMPAAGSCVGASGFPDGASATPGTIAQCPLVPAALAGKSVYLLEAQPSYGSACGWCSSTWYAIPNVFAADAGGYRPAVPFTWVEPGTSQNCGGSAPWYLAGWPPAVPHAATIVGAELVNPQQWTLECRENNASAANGYQGTWVLAASAAIVRLATQVPTGFPRTRPAGTTAASSATPHPLSDAAGLAAAIRALGATIGDANHTDLAGLFDQAARTFQIPAPNLGETFAAYRARLQAAGFLGNITETVVSTANESPTAGPSAVFATDPAVGTAVGVSTAIDAKVNPADAPAAAPSTEPNAPGVPGGLFTPPTPPGIVLPAIHSPCTTFPFGVPCWLVNQIGQLVTTAEPPAFTLSLPFHQSLTIDLGHVLGTSTAPLLDVVRPAILFTAFVGILVWMAGFAVGGSTGGGGSAGED